MPGLANSETSLLKRISRVNAILGTLCFVLLVSVIHLSRSDPNTQLRNEETPVNKYTRHPLSEPTRSVDDIRAAYDPHRNAARMKERLEFECSVRLPEDEDIKLFKPSWKLSRFVAYHNIYHFLSSHLDTLDEKPRVLDFGGSLFLMPFADRLDILKTGYPHVDIHDTTFPANSFDLVACDQVIEHVDFPHSAMIEVKRILKPGGVAILTTCAYNPYHGRPPRYNDYWRFMPEGLRMLSLPFDGGIKICGSWGTAKVVSSRASKGLLSGPEKKAFDEIFDESVKKNEEHNPFTTWIVVQK